MTRKPPHVPDPTTVAALMALSGGKNWRGLPLKLNEEATKNGHEIWFGPSSFGSLHGLAKGQPGAVRAETEDLVRLALGLKPISALRFACPTCGQYHSLTLNGTPVDCHGAPVAVRPTKGAKDYHQPSYRPRLDPKWRKYSVHKIERILCKHEESENADSSSEHPCDDGTYTD